MPEIDLGLLAARESEQVEWKQNVADVDDVVATLCAFANDLANLGGGYVVCGATEISDEHGFPALVRTGLTADRLREVEGRVLARCRERVSPPLVPLVSKLPSDAADRRILVFTQPATQAAHLFRRGSDGGRHFVRVGRSTLEARNGVLLDLLVRKGAAEPWDRQACQAASERDLDLLVLRDTLNQMGVALPDGRVEQFLAEDVALSPFVPSFCVREPLTNVLRPRNFAILLFGRNVQRFVPGAFSLFSVYPGRDRSDRHAERHEIAGSLVEQARRLRQLLDGQVTTLFDKADLTTPNALKYPPRALYEAMGNALAHRDYALVEPIRVTVFADRIEFVSPGALPLGVDPHEFEQGVAPPKWRNQALAWFFNRLQLAQAEGQGIPTILRTMREEGCPPPAFRTAAASVTCVLPANRRHVVLYDLDQASQDIAASDLTAARARIDQVLASEPGNARGWRLLIELLKSSEASDDLLKIVEANAAKVTALPAAAIVDIAGALAAATAQSPQVRQQAITLIDAASRRPMAAPERSKAAAILLQLWHLPGIVALVENAAAADGSQGSTTGRQQADPRMLLSQADIFLNVAVRANNMARRTGVGAHEREDLAGACEEFATRAENLLTRALNQRPDPHERTAINRGLTLIRHLRSRLSANQSDDGSSD